MLSLLDMNKTYVTKKNLKKHSEYNTSVTTMIVKLACKQIHPNSAVANKTVICEVPSRIFNKTVLIILTFTNNTAI